MGRHGIRKPFVRSFRPMLEILEDRLAPATFTVNSTADSDDGLALNSVTTLRKAIRLANADAVADTINFAATLSNQTITLGGTELAITRPLTITGLGADRLKIDGNNASRLFNIDDGTINLVAVSISGLALTHGKADDGNNATFTAADDGGAIINRESLTLTACSLTANQASRDGGGIFNTGPLTLTGSILSTNSAGANRQGGGIFHSGSATLTVTHSTLSGNTAGFGGAIFDAGPVTVTNSTISGNAANQDGGGIFNQDRTLTLTNVTLVNNRADADGNNTGIGGGVWTFLDSQTFTHLFNTIVAGNRKGVSTPNDIDNKEVESDSANNLIGDPNSRGGLTNGTNGNIVGKTNGAVLLPLGEILDPTLNNNGGSTLTHALVSTSPAIDKGSNARAVGLTRDQRGAPFNRIVGAAVDIGAYERQTAVLPALVVDTVVDEADGNYTAGDLSLREAIGLANGSVGASTITFAAGLTGKTITLGGSLPTITEALTISGLGSDRLKIDGNNSSRIFEVDDRTTTQIVVSISGLELTHGKADDGNNAVSTSGDDGGAIFNQENLTLTGCLLDANHASRDGGGIFSAGALAVINSTCSANSAGGDGGGIDAVGTLAVTSSTISTNSANNGGGISSLGTLMVTSSTLSANSAANAGGGVDGAGSLTFINTTVSGNAAGVKGGGIKSVGNLTLVNTTLSANSSTGNGGGIDTQGTLALTDSTLSGNSAGGNGGGIFTLGTVTLTGSSLSTNSAGGDGGGIFISGGTVTLTNSILSANSAGGDGGGIFHHDSNTLGSANLTLTNSTFSGNSAGADGGGILNNGGGTLTVTNSTFSANTANSGGAIGNLGALTLTNTTLSANSARGAGGGIFNDATLTATNSTLVANRANSDGVDTENGGGIHTGSTKSTTLFNTVLAGNLKGLGAGTPDDLNGDDVQITSVSNLIGEPTTAGGLVQGSGGNILGKNNGAGGRMLRPLSEILDPVLRNNGGPTLTHALVPGSAAINAGNFAAVTPVSEIQTILLTGTLSGTFSLTFNGQTTTATLTGNSPTLAADTENALNSLSTIGGVGGFVSVTQSGTTLSVTFGGLLANTSLPLMSGAGSGGLGALVTNSTEGHPGPFSQTGVSETQRVTLAGTLSGFFSLTFNGRSTGLLTGNSPTLAADTQSALNNLTTVGDVGGFVTVVQSGSTLAITFGGALANSNVPQMAVVGQGGLNATIGTTTVGYPDLFTDQRGAAFPRLVDGIVDIGAVEMPRDLMTDTFTRANDAALGSPWVARTGSLGIAGNQARGTGATTVHLSTIANVSAADVDLFASVALQNGQEAGLVARFNGPGNTNYYLGTLARDGSGNVVARIVRNSASTGVTELTVIEGIAASAGTLRFRVFGATLQLYLNGNLIAAAEDATFRTGSFGLRTLGTTAVDDFQVWPLASGVAGGDSFTLPDNTLLGDPWFAHAGYFGTVGGKARGGQSLDLATFGAGNQADVDVRASATVAGLGHQAGLVARHVGPGDNNYYLGQVTRTATGFTAQILKKINGATTILATTNIPATTGTVNLRLLVKGANIQFFVNAVSAGDVLDTALTSGKVGIRGDAFARLDDFAIFSIDTALPFADKFDQTDGAELQSNWVRRVGNFKSQGNQAVGTATSPSVNLATLAGVRQANVSVRVNIALTTTNHQIGLVACYSGPGDTNYYLGQVVKTTAGFTLGIIKNVGGTATTLKTSSNVSSLTGPIELQVLGTNLRLLMNGVEMLSVRDASLTTGSVGIRSIGTGTINNFLATGLNFLPFNDDFTADTLNPNWSIGAGGYSTTGIADRVRGTAAVNLMTLGRLNASDVDFQADISVPGAAGRFASLVARSTGAGDLNMYLATVTFDGSNFVASIAKKINGVTTTLATVNLGQGTGTLRFNVVGGKLKLFFDGVEKLSVVDFTLSAGSVGIRSSLDATFDNLSATQAN